MYTIKYDVKNTMSHKQIYVRCTYIRVIIRSSLRRVRKSVQLNNKMYFENVLK